MREDYQNAKKLGDKEHRRATLSGHYPYLPALDDIIETDGKFAEVQVGITEIPLNQVVGTKTRGRQQAFADNFMPIMREGTEFASKWADLYDAQVNEGIRDPILCYEYMQKFYVMEGNKRVSVLKYFRASYVTANVIRVLPVKTDDPENRLYYEFVEYYKVAPMYDIVFSKEGSYRQFAEVIGKNLEDPWDDDTIQNVKAAYATFTKLFLQKGGDRLDITAGDAFLMYLKIYPLDSFFCESQNVLSDRLTKIWNEILTQNKNDGVIIVDSPSETRKTAGILDFLTNQKYYTKEKPLRVCFIYSKNPTNSSWVYGHELGRNYVQNKFGGIVDTIEFSDCDTDEKVRKAVDTAAVDEDRVVFTTSPVQMPETLRSAIHYPNIKFLNCSINLSSNAVRTYYGKMYEPKYLMGALAAIVSPNHKIGYLADYPIYGVIANINAFAIGAAMIDPEARIYLKWTTDEKTDWKKDFEKENITVISGQDFIKPENPTREYGLYVVDREHFSIKNLAAPVWDWGKYYELIIRTILDGSWDSNRLAKKDTALNYWYGFASGVVDVIVSDDLSYYTKRLFEYMKKGIVDGRINPFDGEIHSQTGIIRKPDDPELTRKEIITMNWLNDNIIGSLPKIEELNEEAKDTVSVSGILSGDNTDRREEE